MATEQAFQLKFAKPLAECYGQIKLPAIRLRSIWERVKHLPDHILAQCADRIILNFDNFPGVQNILNTCAEVAGEYTRLETERLKAEIKCFRCRSQGVVIANNYAYKCTCQLGELLYPKYPLYEGQTHIEAKIFTDEEGNRVYEDNNYRTVTPVNCRSVRDVRTVIKSNIVVLKKNDDKKKPQKLDFSSFLPDDKEPA